MCRLFQENSPTGCIQRRKMTSDEQSHSKPLLEQLEWDLPVPLRKQLHCFLCPGCDWCEINLCPVRSRAGGLRACGEVNLEQRSSGSWTNAFASHLVAFWRCLAGMCPGCAAHRSHAKPSPHPSRSRRPGKIYQVELSQRDHESFTPLVNRFTRTGFSYRLYWAHHTSNIANMQSGNPGFGAAAAASQPS